MPCTQYQEDQEQQSRRSSFRSTFSRTFAGLRFPDHQNLNGFSISPSSGGNSSGEQVGRPQNHNQLQLQQHAAHLVGQHLNHPHAVVALPSLSIAASSAVNSQAATAASSQQYHVAQLQHPNSDDLTEQIRISVHDTHISQQAFINELGGNIADVLDSFEENMPAYHNGSTDGGNVSGNQFDHHHIMHTNSHPLQQQHHHHHHHHHHPHLHHHHSNSYVVGGNILQQGNHHHEVVVSGTGPDVDHQAQGSSSIVVAATSSSSRDGEMPPSSSSTSHIDIYAPHTSTAIEQPQSQGSALVAATSQRRLVVLPDHNNDSNNGKLLSDDDTTWQPLQVSSNSNSCRQANNRQAANASNSTNIDTDQTSNTSESIVKLLLSTSSAGQAYDNNSARVEESEQTNKCCPTEEIDPTNNSRLGGCNNQDSGRSYGERDSSTLSSCFANLFPPYTNHRQVGVIKNNLYNGSSFTGDQKSEKESYKVNVKIQHVDYESSYMCGYLCINHLTKSHPSLTTFFEGEIISEQYPFLTRKWEATEEIDRAHWSKFEGFDERFSQTFNLDSFDYNQLKDSEYIFMRWKEHFLVPDHTIKYVEGASYAGFYYICYSKRTSRIKGYYFHINSEHFESFQSLNLRFEEQGSSQVYEFR